MTILANIIRPILSPITSDLTSAVKRFFRLNEGTTDYVAVPEMSISGVVIVTISFASYTVSSNQKLFRFGKVLAQVDSDTSIKVWPDTSSASRTFTVPSMGTELHKLKVEFDTSNNEISITLDDNPRQTDAGGLLSDFSGSTNRLGASTTAGRFNGVLSSVAVVNNGSLIRSYAMDDDSDTISDSVSGQDGTVINGAANDWGLFYKKDTVWIGSDLAVPPWDSVNQELPEA